MFRLGVVFFVGCQPLTVFAGTGQGMDWIGQAGLWLIMLGVLLATIGSALDRSSGGSPPLERNKKTASGFLRPTIAHAHCDVPCGIYDPVTSQLAALSVARFLDLIAELDDEALSTLEGQTRLMRLTEQKEQHAGEVKAEINVIWGDYFKTAHFERFPEISNLAHDIMQTASRCKQTNNVEDGRALVEQCNEFATIFWATKDIEVQTVLAPYAPALPVIQPALTILD